MREIRDRDQLQEICEWERWSERDKQLETVVARRYIYILCQWKKAFFIATECSVNDE